jgi:hypothetical protein
MPLRFEGTAANSGAGQHAEEWHDLSPAEQEQLRQEVVDAPALDFDRFLSDIDYNFHIHENPRMQKVRDDIVADAVLLIASYRAELGLSSEQIDRIEDLLGPGVRTKVVEQQKLESEMNPLIRQAVQEHDNPSEANHKGE